MKIPWSPAIYSRDYSRVPEIGSVIAIDGRGWRILRVEDVNPGNWSERADRYWATYAKAGQDWETWECRPRKVYAQPLTGDDGRSYSMTIEPDRFPTWYVLPEHYAVCALCGDLAPCQRHIDAMEAQKAMREAEEAMKVPDGCCPACTEPITTRQVAQTFDGPNLWNPLGAPNPRFHMRRQCAEGRKRYEQQWRTTRAAGQAEVQMELGTEGQS